MKRVFVGIVALACASVCSAHFADFKSPGPGMHFTVGQPIIVFADVFDANNNHGMIVCPGTQTAIVPTGGGPATCSGGGTPVGWPQFQVLVDGIAQTDSVTHSTTVRGSTDFDPNGNPDPINFYRFSVTGLSAGTHQMIVRGHFAPPPDFRRHDRRQSADFNRCRSVAGGENHAEPERKRHRQRELAKPDRDRQRPHGASERHRHDQGLHRHRTGLVVDRRHQRYRDRTRYREHDFRIHRRGDADRLQRRNVQQQRIPVEQSAWDSKRPIPMCRRSSR